jgi:hypothetical protein
VLNINAADRMPIFSRWASNGKLGSCEGNGDPAWNISCRQKRFGHPKPAHSHIFLVRSASELTLPQGIASRLRTELRIAWKTSASKVLEPGLRQAE